MARRWNLGLLGGAAVAAGAAACATIAGLGDYESGSPAVDASIEDGASGVEAAAPIDAGFDVPQLPSCGAGYVCFAPVEGWEGPFLISELPVGSDAGLPPGCPGAAPYRDKAVLTDLVVPDASCSCTCTTQATCSATFTIWNNGSCTTACSVPTLFDDSGCLNTACSFGFVSATANPAAAACTPFTQGDIPDAGFATRASSCEAATVDSGACEAGTTCAATPGQGFDPGLCIRKQGDNACPGGSPYAIRRVYYQGILDDRSCVGCGCTVTQEANCFYDLDLWSEAGCKRGGQGILGVTPGTCPSATVNAPIRSVSVTIPQPDDGGACSAEGGTVAGEAGPDPTDAVTYCCTP